MPKQCWNWQLFHRNQEVILQDSLLNWLKPKEEARRNIQSMIPKSVIKNGVKVLKRFFRKVSDIYPFKEKGAVSQISPNYSHQKYIFCQITKVAIQPYAKCSNIQQEFRIFPLHQLLNKTSLWVIIIQKTFWNIFVLWSIIQYIWCSNWITYCL